MTIDYTPDVNPVLYGIGGRPYGAKRLSMLKNYLAKRRVELLVGPEAVNELRGYVAGFQAFPDGTARMLFAPQPRTETVWHELCHFLLWYKIGSEAYLKLPRVYGNHVPEQFVFEQLQHPHRWDRLTPDYRILMDETIRIKYGGMGR